ncbi:MAG: response regulator [Chloroflexi bacterium]|nr:response regulator [Chloroflexota bacterium]MBI4507689.1 response regulator [Chloroflexota bacterium]
MAKILVVSADRIAADAVTDILAEGGHSATVMSGIESAVEHLRGHSFDVVITDAFGRAAPGELDWKAMRALLDVAEDVPVVLCSEWLTEAATAEAEDRFADIIWKPLDPDDLVERVNATMAGD